MRSHSAWMIGGLVAIGLGLAACGPGAQEFGEVSQSGPATVQSLGGDAPRVVLTAEAVHKLGLHTAAVQVAPASMADAGTASETAVPVDAVIYDKDGNTWVYKIVGPRSYERRAVNLVRADAETAVLRDGPPPGTQVVVAGAQELLGAELGVAGE